jgi:hypothetical protein
MTDASPPDAAVTDAAPTLAELHTTAAVVGFVVVVAAPTTEAPRVSVRAAPGNPGVVDIVGVEERDRAGDVRRIAFRCEADRGDVDFAVSVVVDRPGRPLVTLPGPAVPARGRAP